MPAPTPETPAALGFYMPAEWRTHDGTWLTWPKDPETWPDRVPQVEEIYLQMMAALAPHETVNLLVDDTTTEHAVKKRCSFPGVENICFHQIPTVDSWIRDYGPNFLIDNRGNRAFNNWIFNAWGNKYETLKHDDRVPLFLEPILQIRRFEPRIVLEGGAIDVNGAGCVLTTEQCLLNPNRNPSLSREQIEQYLLHYYGQEQVLWVEEGIVGDDTDGHIDDTVRFVNEDTVLAITEENRNDENYELLKKNLKDLKQMRLLNGKQLNIVELPMPNDVIYEDKRLPASYANFYISNQAVIVPTYRCGRDDKALSIIQQCFPGKKIVGIDSTEIIWGLGSFHCLSQQEPSV